MKFIYTVTVEADIDDDALEDDAVLDGIAVDLGNQIQEGVGGEINGHNIESVSADETRESRLSG